jgi:hypothetical protein
LTREYRNAGLAPELIIFNNARNCISHERDITVDGCKLTDVTAVYYELSSGLDAQLTIVNNEDSLVKQVDSQFLRLIGSFVWLDICKRCW